MFFNSIQYILFLPAVVILFYLTPLRFRWLLLLAASYYFYMCWKPEFIVVIVVSTLINYSSALLMSGTSVQKRKKLIMISTLVINLGLLVIFKYLGFIAEMFQTIFQSDHPSRISPALLLIAPIGISYYTLQSLSYIIDVYYGRRDAEKHPGIFALYVAFFPLILSGPIERSTHLLPSSVKKNGKSYTPLISKKASS